MNEIETFSKMIMLEKFAQKIKDIDPVSRAEKIGIIAFSIFVPSTFSLLLYNNIIVHELWYILLFSCSLAALSLVSMLIASVFSNGFLHYKDKEEFYTRLEKKLHCNNLEYATIFQVIDSDVGSLPKPDSLKRIVDELIESYKEQLINKESLEKISSCLKKTGELYHDEKKGFVLNYLLEKYNSQVEKEEKSFKNIENNMAKAGIIGSDAVGKRRNKIVIEETD